MTTLTATVSKVQERCPLKFSFVRALKALDPRMISGSDEVTTSFSNITRKIVSANIMSSDQCDAAERQYKRMVREKADDIKQFDAKTQRLDQFYYQLLEGSEYQELWKVVKRVLVLSHGQAKVERGFSVNEDMLLPNLKQETLMGQRTVYDAVKSL